MVCQSTAHPYRSSGPSVGPSVGRSVGCYSDFEMGPYLLAPSKWQTVCLQRINHWLSGPDAVPLTDCVAQWFHWLSGSIIPLTDWVAQWFIFHKETEEARGSNPTEVVFPLFSGESWLSGSVFYPQQTETRRYSLAIMFAKATILVACAPPLVL